MRRDGSDSSLYSSASSASFESFDTPPRKPFINPYHDMVNKMGFFERIAKTGTGFFSKMLRAITGTKFLDKDKVYKEAKAKYDAEQAALEESRPATPSVESHDDKLVRLTAEIKELNVQLQQEKQQVKSRKSAVSQTNAEIIKLQTKQKELMNTTLRKFRIDPRGNFQLALENKIKTQKRINSPNSLEKAQKLTAISHQFTDITNRISHLSAEAKELHSQNRQSPSIQAELEAAIAEKRSEIDRTLDAGLNDANATHAGLSSMRYNAQTASMANDLAAEFGKLGFDSSQGESRQHSMETQEQVARAERTLGVRRAAQQAAHRSTTTRGPTVDRRNRNRR